MRTYVVRVSGMISKRDPRKTEIVRRLLAPIETWRPAAARGKAAETAPGTAKPSPVEAGTELDAP